VIAGLGVDVVHLPDFAAQLAVPGSAFADGVFTAGERADAARGTDPARHLAARWAAKEAFLKAWSGASFGQPPALARADLQEIEVIRDAWGRPALRLHGAVATLTAELRAWVSLSHDGPVATAVVVLERDL
jgi:holo-[acyl-carrier protein] synthase